MIIGISGEGRRRTTAYHVFWCGGADQVVFIQSLCPGVLSHFSLLGATVLTVPGYQIQPDTKAGGDHCGVVGILGISWAFDGMIFILYTGSINIFINEVEAENKDGLLPDLILLLKRSMSTPDFDVGVTLDFNGGVTTSCLQSR